MVGHAPGTSSFCPPGVAEGELLEDVFVSVESTGDLEQISEAWLLRATGILVGIIVPWALTHETGGEGILTVDKLVFGDGSVAGLLEEDAFFHSSFAFSFDLELWMLEENAGEAGAVTTRFLAV